ncbi:serine hydrolase domain-containing protein [Brevundimonas aurifodinae]|uniref:Serine hydrolase n=1 Tax=Brevundimonas aurifodinae TaxID=1508312 RepID=A0ABV1NL31_9CAUL
MPLTRRRLIAAGTAAGAISLASLDGKALASSAFEAAKAYSAAARGISFLVVQDGAVIAEDYPNGGAATRPHELASGTKSFCGVLAAALVQDRLLTLDEHCAETLPEWRQDPTKTAATIRTLLTLTSGIAGGDRGRPPTYAASLESPVIAAPDTVFRYSGGPFQVFGEIVRRKLVADGRSNNVYNYMSERLLDPIGIRPGGWTRQEDQPNLPSGARLTAQDWARFGGFVMGGGRLNGVPLVDPDALAACFAGTRMNPGYGLTWWLLRPGLVPPSPFGALTGLPGEFDGLPDVRMAAGAGNQRLYLIPERNTVVVRQAAGIMEAVSGQRAHWSDAEFLRLLPAR